MFRPIQRLLAAGLLAGGLAACAAPAVRCIAPDDIPPYLYSKGMEALDDQAFRLAEARFDRALFCDNKFSPGYSGLALLFAESSRGGRYVKQDPAKADLSREYLEKAYRHADGQQDLFDYLVAKIRAARVLKGKGWLEEAEGAWRQAGELSLDKAKLLYYTGKEDADYFMGLAYLDVMDLPHARERFAVARKREGKWQESADRSWRKTDKILRALAGSIPDEIGGKLALNDSISRGDLAALLVDELKVNSLLSGKPFPEPTSASTNLGRTPADVASHPYRKEIETIISLKLRGLVPMYDGTLKEELFKPAEGVSRGEMALVFQDLMARLGREKESTVKSEAKGVSFSDVRPGSPFFPAVLAMTGAGIMEAEASGEFRINDVVDGAEALLALRVIKQMTVPN